MKLIKILSVLFYSYAVFAQTISPTEVTVIEGFIPTIPDSEKIKETTIFLDTAKDDKSQKYTFIDKTIDANYKSRPLVPAKVSGEKSSKLYKSRFLIGFGSQYTTNANIVINSLIDDNYSYGGLLNHFNNHFKIDDKKAGSSNNYINLFGKKIGETNILIANLEHERKRFFSYGHNYIQESSNSFKNRFDYTKFSISAISKELSANQLKHNTSFFISDLNEMSENRIHLSSVIRKYIGYPLTLDIQAENYLNSNIEESLSLHNQENIQLFSISPSISLRKFNIDFNIGIGLDYESEGGLDIFPTIITEKEIVKDILLISLGVQDNKYRNTYKTLSDINPYIHALGTNQNGLVLNDTVQDLRTTETKEVFFTIRNVLGEDEIFNGNLSFGYVENFPFFNNNYDSDVNRFLVDYKNIWQLHADLDYEWQINNLIGIHLEADYYNWGDDTVLHRSNIEAEASVSVNLQEKIKLYSSVSYLGKRGVFGGNFILPLEIIHLDPQFHANLSINYNYTSSISAFLKINNITNSRTQIWNGYKSIGINALFGVSYSF